MIEGYKFPAEMPEIFLNDDGIVNVIFGTILVTVEHIIYSVEVQRGTISTEKMPIMMVGETALKVQGDLSRVGQTAWVADTTSALAIVTQSKLARILGAAFMKVQKNPFPTKLFDSEKDAKVWLRQFCTPPS